MKLIAMIGALTCIVRLNGKAHLLVRHCHCQDHRCEGSYWRFFAKQESEII